MKTPETLNRSYLQSIITVGQFYGELLGCGRSYSAAEVVAVLAKREWQGFKDYVAHWSRAKGKHEILSINGPAPFGMAEIRKFAQYFEENPIPPGQE